MYHLFWLAVLAIGISTTSRAQGKAMRVTPNTRLTQLRQVILDSQGRISLAKRGKRYPHWGSYQVEMKLPAGTTLRGIRLVNPQLPPRGSHTLFWPALTTDLITQVRVWQHAKWGAWLPRNLLAGGNFADTDGNGIPDFVSVMRLSPAGDAHFLDRDAGWEPPPGNWWQDKPRHDRGDFVVTNGSPVGMGNALRLHREPGDSQDTAAMRKDLVPPNTTLTISGWTRYNLGDQTSMGMMARFHEFNRAGERVNKYVLLGDDDFHQPSRASEWRWRAITFTTARDTTYLNLYPIRMIAAGGQAWAAAYEVREGSVFSPWGKGKVVFREEFRDPQRWEFTDHTHSRLLPQGGLSLEPLPLTVSCAVQKDSLPVQAGRLYSFRVNMENHVPSHYEPTHQSWCSVYLEFLDGQGRFLEYVKAMVFRPTLGRPLGAAMHAPPEARQARFRLVASHISYGDRGGMTGPMRVHFARLQLEESRYDPTFTPRPAADRITFDPPLSGHRIQIRTLLLSRDPEVTPSFGGYELLN